MRIAILDAEITTKENDKTHCNTARQGEDVWGEIELLRSEIKNFKKRV